MQLSSEWSDAVSRKLLPSPYLKDPVGWANTRVGATLWSKQREIARMLVDNKRVAVQSAHATGKSFNASMLSAWWVDAHPPGEALVVSTAPTREQVHSILWEEIRKLHREHNLRGEVQRSDRWLLGDGTLVGMGRKPADHMQSAFQGLHRRYVLVIMDEAGGIPKWLWDAARTITTGPECRILAIGNPDDNTSEFARVCQQDKAWANLKISAFDSPNFTGEPVPQQLKDLLVDPEWVEDCRISWGENSALYKAKILGEFADSESGLIPLSWVTAANHRWRIWNEDNKRSQKSLRGQSIYGVDVGHMGEDKTVIASRKGKVVLGIEAFSKQNTVEVVNLVEQRMGSTMNALAVVDGIGVGAGVVDLLQSHGKSVMSFIASGTNKLRDSSGYQKFINNRSAAWWNMREQLDPSRSPSICLPPDDQLTADLTAPTYDMMAGGKIKVEGKDDIRKRLGRSTDYGDAVVQAFWIDTVPPERDQIFVPQIIPYADAFSWN